MAMPTSISIYPYFLQQLLAGSAALSDVFKVALLVDGFTTDIDDDQLTDTNIGTNEYTATGYARQTMTLSAVHDLVNNYVTLNMGADVSWSGMTDHASDVTGVLVYDDTHANDCPVLLHTFTTPINVVATFDWKKPANPFFKFDYDVPIA